MKRKEELETDVLSAAAESGIGITLFRNAMAKRLNLTLTESLCLTALGTHHVSTPTEIAKFTGLTTGSTTTMLDRLEERKFIRRTRNPNDRRGVIVQIDDGYAKRAWEMVAAVQKAHRDVVSSYSAAELAVIKDFLARFSENLRIHAAVIDRSTPG